MSPSSTEMEFSALVGVFRSSIARPTDTPVYASTNTSRCQPQDSGPRWIRFLLSCRTLSFPTTCRFIPALDGQFGQLRTCRPLSQPVQQARRHRLMTGYRFGGESPEIPEPLYV